MFAAKLMHDGRILHYTSGTCIVEAHSPRWHAASIHIMAEIVIPWNAARRWLLPAALILLSAHLLVWMYHYWIADVPWLVRQLVALDEENNLPTWFSSFLLLTASAALVLKRAGHDPMATGAMSTTRELRFWSLLAGGFFVLAIDEVAGLHESFHSAIDTLWVWSAAVLVAACALYFVPLLRILPRRTMLLYVLSGAIFVGGALGVETIGAPMDADTLIYEVTVLVEEGMEMMGVLLFIDATLASIGKKTIPVRIG